MIDYAVEIAMQSNATVHSLAVVDERVLSDLDGDLEESVHETLETKSHHWVGAVADAATDAGLETISETRFGDPSEQILEYANDADIDLIVLGQRGADHYNNEQLGSVSNRIVTDTSRPVLVYPIS